MADVIFVSASEKLKGHICPGYAGATDFKCNALQRCCENDCCYKDLAFPLIVLAILAVFLLIALARRYCKVDEKAKVVPAKVIPAKLTPSKFIPTKLPPEVMV